MQSFIRNAKPGNQDAGIWEEFLLYNKKNN